ncbi:hypothetical protein OBBRIDRAFT_727181 [Obba rivulosa]|uniref:Uncharacterized protein n=1 Tax=Obba rivulosa TaxID=1052685 RepID=A0A8E2AXS7_9APHY|nr:hypothetical protein OBBRIDRAFT_727181 [Obba rivulosa]
MLKYIRALKGYHFGSEEQWGPRDLTPGDRTCQVVFVDACLSGLAVYFPRMHKGYYSNLPASTDSRNIFYWEALAVCSAVHLASKQPQQQGAVKKLGIFCDNTNAIDLFKSYKAKPEFNPILKSSVNVMIAHDMEVRVAYVSGKENIVADALSRDNFALARWVDPDIQIAKFTPPGEAVGKS